MTVLTLGSCSVICLTGGGLYRLSYLVGDQCIQHSGSHLCHFFCMLTMLIMCIICHLGNNHKCFIIIASKEAEVQNGRCLLGYLCDDMYFMQSTIFHLRNYVIFRIDKDFCMMYQTSSNAPMSK